jgi:hypothetical protein
VININPIDMNYLVHPQDLVFKATAYIGGYKEMVKEREIPQWDQLQIALDVASEWTSDWDEDQGFGSSDTTFMLKDYIDTLISVFGYGLYETKFTPRLTVVEYSEADHHEMVQRMESGI